MKKFQFGDSPADQIAKFIAAQMMNRRRLLQVSGIAATTAAISACGVGGSSNNTDEPTEVEDLSDTEKVVDWSNWVAYIDVDEDAGTNPTLDEFAAQTGITVNYIEDYNDNNEFFAKVRPLLENGQSIDRDLVTPTDWMAGQWISLGYAQAINFDNVPNKANLYPDLLNVSFDPGRIYSMSWQGGYGGLGWNKTKVKELTGSDQLVSLDDFFAPALAGKISVLSEMRETVGCIMSHQGANPSDFTSDQFYAALDYLEEQIASGQIRQVTGNDYLAALESGDIIAAIGWSGDVAQLGSDFQFAIPAGGGILWTDNLIIPVGARHKKNAETLINYYYEPEIAARVAAYVQYITPVNGAREEVAKIDPSLVDNPLIFPSDEDLANVKPFMLLDADTEKEYQDAFQAVIGN
ncbi:MAG: spermidine/putrescine ABC transporter substrate-binding protein [Actinobacteria bacterium]|nr:spermidine/putrescine ABC transporter substrate-binding protein [Actinomycetota bacterium]